MKTETQNFTHWPDTAKAAAALWLFVSPWIMSYSKEGLPVWNGWAVAIIVAVFSVAARLRFCEWKEWINFCAGFWLVASPWFLDYKASLSDNVALMVAANHVIIGLIIIFLSLIEL
jgi:SPW repeat